MTNEEAQKILDKLQESRPEQLNGEAKKIFEAIMTIADNRDELKQLVKEKDKELEMLKDIKEIAESKITELNPIRISKNESVIK